MVTSKSAFCLVVIEDEKIIGFVSGTENISMYYKEFLRKNFLKASIILFPKLSHPKIAKKINETLFYPVKKEKDLPEAELLSIVVEKSYQGKGISLMLFEKMIDEFKKKKINKFKVVVGSNLTAACRFYEKMGGVLHSEVEVHKGEKSRIYIWKI